MGGELEAELSQLREKSRQALEASWSRAETLQQELAEVHQELNQLEHMVTVKKMMKSSASFRQSMQSVASNADLGNNSSSNSRKRESMASQMQPRGSMGTILSNRSSIGNLLAPRMSLGGRLVSSSAGDEQDDVRITLMRQDREAKIEELKQSIQGKEEEIAKLQEKTMKQQEDIQRQNASLQEIEAPHLCKSLKEQLAEQEELEKTLEKELKELQGTLTEQHIDLMALEEEWHDCEDRVEDAEATSASILEVLHQRIRRYRKESSKAEGNRSQMTKSTQESLESLRQDLMEYMTSDACTKFVRDLKTKFIDLRQKEDELGRLVTKRIKERQELYPTLRQLNTVHNDLRELLKSVLTLTSKIEQAALYIRKDTNHEAAKGNASKVAQNLEGQIGPVLDQLSNKIRGIVSSKRRKDKEQTANQSLSTSTRSTGSRSSTEGETDDVDTDCSGLTQASNRLTYTIQAKTRQMLRLLPDLGPDSANGPGGKGIPQELFMRFQTRIKQKHQALSAIHDDVEFIENKTQSDSERANRKANSLEDEIQFILNGLDEKDRMIAAISGVIDERRDTEASLMEDIEALKKKGVIIEEDDDENEDGKGTGEGEGEEEAADGELGDDVVKDTNGSGGEDSAGAGAGAGAESDGKDIGDGDELQNEAGG